jgi:3-methylcrotonyl-CoA carboxylase alpha subunit
VPPIVKAVGPGVFRVGEQPARTAWAAVVGEARWVFLDGCVYVIESARGGGRPRARGHAGSLAAPMPATVRKINVAPGDRVGHGDALVVLEAMKMELLVRAPAAGVVRALHCAEGELVQPGIALLTLDES